MTQRRPGLTALLGLAALLVLTSPGAVQPSLWSLYVRRDVFLLRDSLAQRGALEGAQQNFLQAWELAAFGQEERSSRILRQLLSTPVARDIERRARTLLMLDERAQFHYGAALAALAPLRAETPADAGVAGRARLLDSIGDAPPEAADAAPKLVLDDPEIDGTVGGTRLRFLIDTAANFSVLGRSAARAAGLRVRHAGTGIEAAGGRKFRADVAVGNLAFGGARLRNVVFLILPDHALPRVGGASAGGVIGLPVLRLSGPLEFRGSRRSRGAVAAPIALVDGDPVIETSLAGLRVLCKLDSGSTRTTVAASLWDRIAPRPARRRFVSVGDATGRRTITLREGALSIGVAGRTIALRRAMIVARDPSGWSCTLGADALAALAPLTLDFARLQLVVH